MLVGICGQAGSGKSTVAQFLVKNYSFVELGLADPLKRFVQDVFDMTDEQIWGPSENRNAPDPRYERTNGDLEIASDGRCLLTPRFALQTLGTEWGRNCYPQVWVDYAIRVHKKLQGGGYGYDQKRGLYTTSMLMGEMMYPKTNVVISDVRFLNEVIGIRNAGGQVWHISRPGADGKVGVRGHASEEEQKSIPHELFDAGISNCSSIANLLEFVDNLMLLAVKAKEK